ncbi:MAG TPA: phosphohistidine phosphatase SixA [Nitrospiria bacterium]|jgi:phosphohistidine phosphatase
MKLFLVRHGEAKLESEDPERSLTEKGRMEAERISQWAGKSGIKVKEIRHSGKKRAEQTAEIISKRIHPPKGVIRVTGISPNDDPFPIANLIDQEDEPLMLVGHLPFLSRLASHLLMNNSNCSLLQFPTAGMVCLEKIERQWSLAWAITPDLV